MKIKKKKKQVRNKVKPTKKNITFFKKTYINKNVIFKHVNKSRVILKISSMNFSNKNK